MKLLVPQAAKPSISSGRTCPAMTKLNSEDEVEVSS
jgi:hypothetical protein